nr:dimeric alpha-beta barrel [Shiraia sp. slf14]
MVVTEIALLRLWSGVVIGNADLKSKLAHAKKVMQDYTGRQFYYYQQIEDPSCIYIIGEWESLDQHMNHFIPSRDNQSVLESLKDLLAVEWLQHIDVSHIDLPLPKTEDEKATIHRHELVLSIVRHFVKDGEKEKFQETFETNKHHLQDFITLGNMGGGWRVDKEDSKEEWVVFCPWSSVEQHQAFASTEGFAKYGQIRGHIDGAEIKHARFLEI